MRVFLPQYLFVLTYNYSFDQIPFELNALLLQLYNFNCYCSCTVIIKLFLTYNFHFQAFLASDITFAMKPYFRGPFCVQDVREGLVVAFLNHITTTCLVSRKTLKERMFICTTLTTNSLGREILLMESWFIRNFISLNI